MDIETVILLQVLDSFSFASLTLTVTGISCFQEGARTFLLPGSCSFTCWPDVLPSVLRGQGHKNKQERETDYECNTLGHMLAQSSTAYEFPPPKSASYRSFLPYFIKEPLVITGVDGSEEVQ